MIPAKILATMTVASLNAAGAAVLVFNILCREMPVAMELAVTGLAILNLVAMASCCRTFDREIEEEWPDV